MSATPVNPTSVKPVVTSWFRIHERLIIAVLVIALCGYGLTRYWDASAARAEAQASYAAQQLAEAKTNAAVLASQTAQVAQQYQAIIATLSAQNNALAASVAQRNTVLVKQQTSNAVLPLPDLITRWNTLAGTSVTVNGTTAVVSVQDSVRTVNLIEQVPVLQNNLADETKIAQNTGQELASANLLTGKLNDQVNSLQTEITADDKACKAQVATVKAVSRRSKLRYFGWGYVAGFISGVFAGHAAGI